MGIVKSILAIYGFIHLVASISRYVRSDDKKYFMYYKWNWLYYYCCICDWFYNVL